MFLRYIKNSIFWYLFISILISSSCVRQDKSIYVSFGGFTQGTTYSIIYKSTDSVNYHIQIDSILNCIDNSLSTYNKKSIISKVNNNISDVVLDSLFIEVFKTAFIIHYQTNGAFDLTVGPLTNAYGFGPDKKRSIDNSIVDSLLQFVGMDMVSMVDDKIVKKHPSVKLDVNAIAQGYSVDLIADFFDKQSISDYLVEIGGEIRTSGRNKEGKVWRIGIDKPIENNITPGQNLQTIINLSNKSLATSGNYRKFIEENGIKYSHTINPKTGLPERNSLLSVTVITDECIKADAYATAFMVMGLEKSFQYVKGNDELEAYFIYSDDEGEFKVKISEGFDEYIY